MVLDLDCSRGDVVGGIGDSAGFDRDVSPCRERGDGRYQRGQPVSGTAEQIVGRTGIGGSRTHGNTIARMIIQPGAGTDADERNTEDRL